MRLAVSQLKTRPGDLARTCARMVAQSHAAAEQGADLLMFPYATLLGAGPVAPGARVSLFAGLFEALEGAAREVSCPCLVPIPVDDEGLPWTELVLLEDGELRPVSLPAPYSHEGAEAIPMLEVAGTRMGIARSYEELDELLAPEASRDIHAVCFISPYGFAVNDLSSAMGAALSEGRFVEDVRASARWLMAVGSVGGYGSHVFCGGSFVLAPDGRLAACAASFEEELLVADVGAGAVLPTGSELSLGVYDEPAFLWEALVVGLGDYVRDAGYTDVALALDGSLASLVLAALATDALGPTRVHALDCVPRGHVRKQLPTLLARTLRIEVREFEGSLSRLAETDEALWHDLSEVSLARLARERGALVLSAADKTALALKPWPQGVSVASFAPLGDVYRIDVLDLAHLRNTVSPVLGPVSLVEDDVEGTLDGAAVLGMEALVERRDDAIALRVEGGHGLAEIADMVGDEGLARFVVSRIDELRARSNALPDTLALTTCTLAEYQLPHGMAWRDDGQGAPEEAVWFEGEELEGAADAKEAARERPPLGERDLAEALDLLRDLSLGVGSDWRNPFSEN